jgi:hypothetical protein
MVVLRTQRVERTGRGAAWCIIFSGHSAEKINFILLCVLCVSAVKHYLFEHNGEDDGGIFFWIIGALFYSHYSITPLFHHSITPLVFYGFSRLSGR